MQRLSYWCFSLFAMVVFVASAGITHAQASAQQGGTQPLDAVVQVPTASTQTQALSPAQSRTELRAGWYRWDPYQFQMTKNEITRLTGLDVELLRAIFAKMGYSLV
ncbi:MAG: hypothetical protein WAO93_05270, partial [Orrella sp.]